VKLSSVRLSRSCTRGAALDVAAADQQHQHKVDAVAVHALGRGLAVLALAGLDAELMGLDVLARRLGCEASEQGAAVFQDGAHAGAVANLFGDRLDPALDAAVQMVVVQGLVVRPVRPAQDRALMLWTSMAWRTFTKSLVTGA
jgi:hypothetical protein